MEKFVYVKAYDGSVVKINSEMVDVFTSQQNKIKALLTKGKSLDEVLALLKEGKLKWALRVLLLAMKS